MIRSSIYRRKFQFAPKAWQAEKLTIFRFCLDRRLLTSDRYRRKGSKNNVKLPEWLRYTHGNHCFIDKVSKESSLLSYV